MRKIALLGLAAVALLGVAAGVHGDPAAAARSHTVVADTGWGNPCGTFDSPFGCHRPHGAGA